MRDFFTFLEDEKRMRSEQAEKIAYPVSARVMLRNKPLHGPESQQARDSEVPCAPGDSGGYEAENRDL